MQDHTSRAWQELGHADFGQAARTTRAMRMWERLVELPCGTVSRAFSRAAERKGAYRWIESDRVAWEPLADAIHVATARRCGAHAMVLGIVDGSSLSHTDRRGDDGVGSVGSHASGGRGLKSMVLFVLSYAGVPLGVGAHALWARPLTPDPTPSDRRALETKESRHWTALPEQFEATLRAQGADTRVWYQLDREADAHHVLLRGVQPGQWVTVRSHYDRLLTARARRRKHLKLREAIASAPVQAAIYLDVPAAPGRTPRVARLEVRSVGVGLDLRAQWSHRRLGGVYVTAVEAREVGTVPPGEARLAWLLLTTFPVNTADDAVRVVRAYGFRWSVERLHFTWKSGACEVESSQLESFEALRKWATLQLSVASERQHLLHLARTQPELPATEVFARDEIDAALLLATVDRHKNPPALGSTPPLGALVDLIARLGGYIGKSSGGPPGVKTFGHGMERVTVAAQILAVQRTNKRPPTSTDGFG